MSRTDKDRPNLVQVYDLTDKHKQTRTVFHHHYRQQWTGRWIPSRYPEVTGPWVREWRWIEVPCDLEDYSVSERLAARRRTWRTTGIRGPRCELWLDLDQSAYRRGSDSSKKIGRRAKRRVTRQWCHEARYNPELDGPPQFPNMTGEKWWAW